MRLRRLSGLIAILTLTASGCAALGGPQAQQSGPIKLGMVTSLTGNYAPLGTNDKLAAQQVIDQQNAKGGVNGRKIEIEILDDGSDPNQSVIQFNKLADGGVAAVLGPPQSTAELALKPVVTDKKVPTVALGASDDQVIPVSPYMWQTAPLSSQVANTCLAFIKQQSKAKLAMLTDTKNAYAVSGHDASQKLLGQYGITLVDDETFELGQTNFAPQFTKIADARPDFLLVWATGAPPVVITKQWADARNGIPLMMTAAEASPLYVQPAGDAAEGVFVQASIGVIGKSLPASNKFKKLIDDFAVPFEQANKYYPPQFAWDGMVAATFVIDAISRKGADREAIRAGLDSIELDTPQGHYTFRPDKHYGLPDSSNLMTVVKNGDFVPAPGATEDQLAKAGQ
ncbi:MAG TPA: ABC transporter substrate-binding protein [Chloroflexota bacterium]|nr:ABC transporter substrate-binding protein [Chloroflexota bacterium]